MEVRVVVEEVLAGLAAGEVARVAHGGQALGQPRETYNCCV
ncbi:hypothetical protein [Streptacidiphilus sp. MAP12-20]